MKTAEETIFFQLKGSEFDIAVAEHLFENGDYHYCLILGHNAVEKVLKAVYVKHKKLGLPESIPLPKLAKNAGLKFSQPEIKFLTEVAEFNVDHQLADVKLSFVAKCTLDFTENYFFRIKSFVRMLRHTVFHEES